MLRFLRCVGPCILSASIAFCALVPRHAGAQDKQELARARAQFQQAIELEQAGNFAAAVQAFREVGQVRMTPQVRFHIAVCEEKLGKWVAALGGFELALQDAESVGPDFKAEVEESVKRLREAVPKLVIARGAGAEAAEIELDGITLGASSIGVAVPLDPGPHIVRAKSPGSEPFEATLSIAAKEEKTVEVELKRGAPIAREAAPEKPDVVKTAAPATPSRVVPYVIGGFGIASLGASGVLFALRQSTVSDLEGECSGKSCPASSRDTFDKLKFYNYSSQIALGVGLVAVGTAVTLIVLEKKPSSSAAVYLAPTAPQATAGASVLGRF